MAGGMSFDVNAKDLEFVEKKLTQWSKETGGNVNKAVEVSARNIKDSSKEYLQFHMGRGNRLKHLPKAIQYEMMPVPVQVGSEAQIEPKDGKKQHSLGAIIEGGSPTTPPKPFMEPALKYEVKGFVKGIEKAMMEGWDGNG